MSEPIWFTFTRIELAVPVVNALLQELHVRDEQIVADELDFVADLVGELLPLRPIAFGAAVFDADDGIFVAELDVEVDQLVAGNAFRRCSS